MTDAEEEREEEEEGTGGEGYTQIMSTRILQCQKTKHKCRDPLVHPSLKPPPVSRNNRYIYIDASPLL